MKHIWIGILCIIFAGALMWSHIEHEHKPQDSTHASYEQTGITVTNGTVKIFDETIETIDHDGTKKCWQHSHNGFYREVLCKEAP
jgi:hypothetical protein